MKKLVLLPLYWIITVSYGQWVDPAPAGGNIYYNNGNVGIGMDSPGALLDLKLSGDSDFLRLVWHFISDFPINYLYFIFSLHKGSQSSSRL